ncbi:hypothetical protein O181_074132 [Austropuccinia psidii MF-1]|uniref:Uncharacterized protein n=1 Tax=Austropuccinia psidii MF-1 TaxID=1389203 RepID=A0A9Q3IBP0_9BASI|nr:hypothetical protein [Austropuccinia psidii MF-1]
MYNKKFNLASHWEELGASFQKICLKEIGFKDLMVITKGWNPTRQFRILEARASRIRENQATIQAIEEQLTETGHTQTPSGSQGAGQISSPVASHHLEASRSVAKSHHSSQFQEVSRIIQGNKGKNKPSFTQRKTESDPMTQKIEHNVVTPESNLKSDALWLRLSQYAEQSHKQFAKLEASHERMKRLTASIDKVVKALQEGHAQLSKASEETRKRLNIVFEGQHHSRRDWDCLDQDEKKILMSTIT